MPSYETLIDRLIHSTVRLGCQNVHGEMSFGTGYIFLFCEADGKGIPCIVTNKHVVKNGATGFFNLTIADADGGAKLGHHERVALSNLQRFCIWHPDVNIDLVAIPIGPILNNASKKGSDYYIAPLSRQLIATTELLASLTTMEEIVMIGYPNGLWDETNNLPIIRKGITATHARLRLNNKPEFLIDAACFPGSSGSPVFLANIGGNSSHGGWVIGDRVALLGTLYAGPQITTQGEIVVIDVPTGTKPIAVGSIPINLGYVIQASELNALEQAIERTPIPLISGSRNGLCACGSGKRLKNCCGKLS